MLTAFVTWLGRARRSRQDRVAQMTPLEGRVLLAADLSADGLLTVTGTDAADAFILRRSPSTPTDLQVQEGTSTLRVFRIDAVRSIDLRLGAGDDTLTIDNAAGLIAPAGVADVPIRFDGGAGNDALAVVGAPAPAPQEELTLGPDAGAGTLVARTAAASQTLAFVGVELLSDTAAATSLTVRLNDQSNLVELSAGATIDGAATASLRALDVTPCPLHSTAPAAASVLSASALPASAPSASADGATAATDGTSAPASDTPKAGRRHKKKAHHRKHHKGASADATSAALTTPGAPNELLIGKTYVAVQFANKQRVVIETGAGDDWASVDLAAPPAGLQSLTLDAGTGSDRSAELARPAGVAWSNAGIEQVGAVRDFAAVTECSAPMTPPPAPQPQPEPGPEPSSPPPVPTDDGDDDPDDDHDDHDGETDNGKPDHDRQHKGKKHGKGGDSDKDNEGKADDKKEKHKDKSHRKGRKSHGRRGQH